MIEKDDGKTQQKSIYELIYDLFLKNMITSLMIISNSTNGMQILRSVYQLRQIIQQSNCSRGRIIFTGCDDPTFNYEDQDHEIRFIKRQRE